MCSVTGIFVQRNMPIMCSVCTRGPGCIADSSEFMFQHMGVPISKNHNIFDIYGSLCTTVAIHWNMYVHFGRHMSSETHANNVNCMYSSASGHTIDFINFI